MSDLDPVVDCSNNPTGDCMTNDAVPRDSSSIYLSPRSAPLPEASLFFSPRHSLSVQ